MKPLETEQSTFVPGGEQHSHYDNLNFNAAGAIKTKPIAHSKGTIKQMGKGIKHSTHPHPKAKPAAPAHPNNPAKAINFPYTGTVLKPFGHYAVGDSIKYRFNPEGYHGRGSYEFYHKGKTHLVGSAKKHFTRMVQLDPANSNDSGEDYNAAGNEKHYPGQWMFTRSLSLYYWDVKDKKFKMYANDPKHVMLHNLPFTVSRHTDTPTHHFYHVYAPGFDTDNIWITASAMRKYARPYKAANDTGEYNAEGSTPTTTKTTTVEGETPIWADVLPIIGLGAGLFAAYKLGAKDGSKAVIGQYIAFGSCGMGLFSIPKVYLQMKALDKALSGKK
jgi:hypothetical protein